MKKNYQCPSELYLKLKQQIIVENKIYTSRNNNLFRSLTLLCNSCFSKNDITEQFNEIIVEIDINSLDINFSLDYTILFFLSKKNNLSLPREIEQFIITDCVKAITLQGIPLNNRSLIAYFIKQSRLKSKDIDIALQSLYNESIELLERGNVIAALDGLFAIEQLSDKDIERIIYNFDNNKVLFNREKIAKLALKLLQWESEKAEDILIILKSSIEEDLRSWVEPDIQFALIESEKLINSNLSQDIINDILDTLKCTGEVWTNIIESIQENGVVVDLKSFQQMPQFCPAEDTWSILALELGKQTSKYELNEAEFNNYKRLIGIDNKGAVASYKGSLILYFTSLLLGIGLSIFLTLNWDNIKILINNILTLNVAPSTLLDWIELIFNPIIVAILIFIWLIRILHFYIKHKDLTFLIVIRRTPIISFLINKLYKEI